MEVINKWYINKCGFKMDEVCVESVTDSVISAGRLCIQQRLSGSLDGDRFVSTTAAVSALRAVTIPPIPGRQTAHRVTGCAALLSTTTTFFYSPFSISTSFHIFTRLTA